jgi:hypothetical protein
VTANPTLGLGVSGSGRPDETQQFVDWLVGCGLKSERAFWLLPSDEHAKVVMLEWIVETQGYTVTELDSVGACDGELESRISGFLAEHPWSSTRSVYDGVKGTQSRIRKLLDGHRFECVSRARGSILWNLSSDRVGDADTTPTQ